MKLDTVRTIAEATSPFVTLYLEGRTPSEDADTQLRLRWEAQREKLEEQDAPESALTALNDLLLDNPPQDMREIQSDGRVLVANGQGVLLDETWDANPGSGDGSYLSEVPELASYVRERAAAVRLLVAVTDQTGAVVRRVVATEDKSLVDDNSDTEITVESSSEDDVQKPRQGALSHNQIQRSADESVKQNARGIAERLNEIAKRWRPDVLVLAGETQGRSALHSELDDHFAELAAIIQDTDEGGAAATGGDGADEALSEVVSTIASDVGAGHRLEQVHRFEEARVRNRTAEGTPAVAQAAGMGAVDTLLLRYEASAPGERSESELLVSCAQTDSEATLIDAPVTENIAAILRYEAPADLGESELNG